MKRVMLIRNVSPEMYGGGETYQLLLARKLADNGYQPMIVTSCTKLLIEARRQGFEVVKAPFFVWQNWSGWRNLLFPIYVILQKWLEKWYQRLFVKYSPKVVNIESRDDWIAATKAADKFKIRVIWTDHMDFRTWVLTNVNVRYKNWIGKWLLKEMHKAYKVVMISDYERQWLERQLEKRKYNNIVTIQNGAVDKMREYAKIQSQPKSVIYLGRIVDYKGIGELIKAFSEVTQKYPQATLKIYGQGKDEEKYRRMAENIPQIQFMGVTDKPLRVLAENEIFVLPSYREGLSLSLLDAAMMEKEIIASQVDGNSEVVKDGKTGLLVPARNIKKLTEAIIWMLDNPKKAEKLAEKAREYYKENFDFDQIFEKKMLPLYNEKG